MVHRHWIQHGAHRGAHAHVTARIDARADGHGEHILIHELGSIALALCAEEGRLVVGRRSVRVLELHREHSALLDFFESGPE